MRRPARVLTAVIAALAVVPITACGDDSDVASSGDTRPLVTFGRGGGEDGKAVSLVVERGGRATLTQYPEKIKRFEVDGDQRSDLSSALDELNIKSLEPNYLANPPTQEGYRYSVTYQETTVQAAEKGDVPDDLKSVIEILDELVDDET